MGVLKLENKIQFSFLKYNTNYKLGTYLNANVATPWEKTKNITKQLAKRDSKLLGILFCRRGFRPTTLKCSVLSNFLLWMYTEMVETKLQIKLNPAIMEETGNSLLPSCSKGPYLPLQIHYITIQKLFESSKKIFENDLHVPEQVFAEA